MLLHLATLAFGLFMLVKSADYLVEYSARIARRFKISDLVVGLVITSVGTSLPELASSLSAALAGSPGLVIGNVVGSNIANTGLVLGIAAVILPFKTETRMYDRDGFILLASTLTFFALALDNVISRLDASILLILYISYVIFATRSERAGAEHRFRDFLKFFFEFEYATPLARRLTRHKREVHTEASTGQKIELRPMLLELLVVVLSLVALIVSARFVVVESVWLAQLLNLPENLIGLSIIAIGTSLPELMVSVAAARKGKAEFVVGNVIGSNIANVLLIVGLSAMVHRLDVAELSVVYTIPIMIFFSLALLYFVKSNWRIGYMEGIFAVGSYITFLIIAFRQGWG